MKSHKLYLRLVIYCFFLVVALHTAPSPAPCTIQSEVSVVSFLFFFLQWKY